MPAMLRPLAVFWSAAAMGPHGCSQIAHGQGKRCKVVPQADAYTSSCIVQAVHAAKMLYLVSTAQKQADLQVGGEAHQARP